MTFVANAVFTRRSGRVISFGRAMMASLFLVALWADPSQPAQAPQLAYSILAAYWAWSIGLAALTWDSWWRDYKLAAPAQCIDIGVFAVMVFLTEGYTSPFYTFFVFILLATMLRWSWRETAITAVVVIAIFLGVGFAALQLGSGEFELERFLFRGAYLIVLSVVLVWFRINFGSAQPKLGQTSAAPFGSSLPPVAEALRYATEVSGAGRALLLWTEREEPWVNVSSSVASHVEAEQFGPEEFDPLLFPAFADQPQPFLLDARHRRALLRDTRSQRLVVVSQNLNGRFMERYNVDNALVARIRAEHVDGELFLLDIPGMCSEDLPIAEQVGAEVSQAFARYASILMLHEAAVDRARLTIARDFHDSVLQSLAGVSFRLKALADRSERGERTIGRDIEDLRQDIASEQRHLRGVISRLKTGRGRVRPIDLPQSLELLCDRVARQWGVTCRLVSSGEPIAVSATLEHEIHQLISEAAANAVRHGQASAISVAMRVRGGALVLTVQDDGRGFTGRPGCAEGAGYANPQPRSISERVRNLGGELSIASKRQNTELQMKVPMETGLDAAADRR